MQSKSQFVGFASTIANGNVRKETAVFALILLATATTASPSVPTLVAYALVVASYGILFVLWVSDGTLSFMYYRPVFYPAAVISLMFVISFVFNFGRSNVLRLLSFAGLTWVNIIVIPAMMDRTAVYNALSRVTAIFVVIALPVTLLGSYTIMGITVGTFGPLHHFGPVLYHIPRSIFMTSNLLAALAAFGAIAAGAEYVRKRTTIAAGLVVINTIGVLITLSRSGILTLGAAAGLYLAYKLYDWHGLAIVSILGPLAFVSVLWLKIADVSAIPLISKISLTGREVIWQATYEAITRRPLIGWGLGSDDEVIRQWIHVARFRGAGTHNSYLRVFLIGGIIAGISYIILSITSLASSLRNVYAATDPFSNTETIVQVFLVMLLIAFLIRQATSDPTIYGIDTLSTLGAVFLGYSQPDYAKRLIDISWLRVRLQRTLDQNI